MIAPSARIATRWLAFLLVLAVVAACGGTASPSGSAAPASSRPGANGSALPAMPPASIPDLAKVELDAGRADRVTIGPEGGELEVKDANGVAYWLVVPPGAVSEATPMAAVPITKLAAQPDQTTLLAGIHLLPDGLQFRGTADLTITLPAQPAAGIVSVAYGGDFTEPHRYPAAVNGSTAKFGVAHFSGYALLSSTTQGASAADIGLLIPWDPPAGPTDRLLADVAAVIDTPGDARTTAINQALRRWTSPGLEGLVSEFRAVTTWDIGGPFDTKQSAVHEALEIWAYLEKLFVLAAVLPGIPEVDRIRSLATTAAVHGISVTNTNCAASNTAVLLVLRLPVLTYWHAIVSELRIGDRDPWFNPDFLTEHACAQVAFNPEGGTDFPVGIEPGQTGTLSLDIGILVDGSTFRFGEGRFNVAFQSDDTVPDMFDAASTDSFGKLTRQVRWDPAAASLRIDAKACLTALPDVCQLASIMRGAVSEPTPATGCPSFTAGNVHGNSWRSSISTSNDNGGAAIGGDMVVSFGMQGTSFRVSGTGTWFVDAASAPPGAHQVTIVWEGQIFWKGSKPGSGGTATVTMGANAPSITSTVNAPGSMNPATIRIEQPLTVRDGELVTITFGAVVSDPDQDVGLSMSGSLDFLTPDKVSILQSECDADD